MSVSKRLRYEILRRDNFMCKYCGGSAPDVKLTVDHVMPITLGGGDNPGNLCAACVDCNAGKSSVPPDAGVVESVTKKAEMMAEAMRVLAEHRQEDRDEMASMDDWFSRLWNGIRAPRNYLQSFHNFLNAGLDAEDIAELSRVAWDAGTDDPWRYFCGCCWTRVRQYREEAEELVDQWEFQEARRK